MLTVTETKARDMMAERGRALAAAGLTPGSSGNISMRIDDRVLVTPTNTRLGFLDPANISKLDYEGRHLSGGKPSKEAFLHLKMLAQRPADAAVVHLHSTHAVAISCMEDVDQENALPPITAYYVMRVGSLPVVPYFAPGDEKLADAVAACAAEHRAVLLSNHGPVASGKSLDAASASIEEIEETARLYLLLRGQNVKLLTQAQIDGLREQFPS